MRKVRRKVLRHAKYKMIAVDLCFLFMAIAMTHAISVSGKMARTRDPIIIDYTSQAASATTLGTQKVYAADMNAMATDTGASANTGTKVQDSQEVIPAERISKIASRDWGAEDAEILLQIAMAEAEGEPTEGKALVMLVVLNRVWDDSEFPDNIHDVVFQQGQFTPTENGRYNSVTPNKDCYEALRMIEQGWDESQGATYFASTDYPHTWHENNLEYLFTVGKHDFYK